MNPKIIIFSIPTILLTIGIYELKAAQLAPQVAQAASEVAIKQTPTPTPGTPPVASSESREASTCREAIRKTWPKQYQETAIFVMTKENGTELPGRLSGLNYDGSLDMGCMQVNDKAHFGYDGWTDKNSIYNAEFNTAYSYRIFQRSGYDWSPWYSVCTVNQVPKYPNINCN